MSLPLHTIIKKFETKIPLPYQEKWDRCGLQVGSKKQEIKRVLFSLDICHEVLREAIASQVDLIVTHHPLSMKDHRLLGLDSYEGEIIKKAIEHKIAIYTAHTNHDNSAYSLSRYYASLLKLSSVKPILPRTDLPKNLGMGAYGRLRTPLKAVTLLKNVKKIFKAPAIRFVGDKNATIKSVGICTGSGAGLLEEVIRKKIDFYITGDLKYHYAVDARRHNICLADPGHFYSEVYSVALLFQLFKKLFGSKIALLEYTKLKDPFINY